MHIAVTGVGIVSALGVGKKVTLDALRTGRSGIVAAPTHFATRNRLPVGFSAYRGVTPEPHCWVYWLLRKRCKILERLVPEPLWSLRPLSGEWI